MSKVFKQFWKDANPYSHPLIDFQTLDFGINDLTARMLSAHSFEEWRNLYHERERVQIERNLLPI